MQTYIYIYRERELPLCRDVKCNWSVTKLATHPNLALTSLSTISCKGETRLRYCCLRQTRKFGRPFEPTSASRDETRFTVHKKLLHLGHPAAGSSAGSGEQSHDPVQQINWAKFGIKLLPQAETACAAFLLMFQVRMIAAAY